MLHRTSPQSFRLHAVIDYYPQKASSLYGFQIASVYRPLSQVSAYRTGWAPRITGFHTSCLHYLTLHPILDHEFLGIEPSLTGMACLGSLSGLPFRPP